MASSSQWVVLNQCCCDRIADFLIFSQDCCVTELLTL